MPDAKVKQSIPALILTLLLHALPCNAEQQTPVFIEPPSPEELAQILYGPRYRSATSGPTTDRFGMLIKFRLDSVQVLPQSLPLLESLGEMLAIRRGAKEVLVIEGHADSRGTHAHNQALSIRRANAIKRYLVNSFNVSPTQLVTVGKGETEPHDRQDTQSEINRRVEFRAIQSIIIN